MLQWRGIWSHGLPSVTPFEQSWRGLWVQGGQGQKVLHHWHLKLLQQREKVLHIISPTFMKKSWSFVCSLGWKKSSFLSRWRGQAVLTENLQQNGVSVRPLIFPGLLGQCILVTYLRPTTWDQVSFFPLVWEMREKDVLFFPEKEKKKRLIAGEFNRTTWLKDGGSSWIRFWIVIKRFFTEISLTHCLGKSY